MEKKKSAHKVREQWKCNKLVVTIPHQYNNNNNYYNNDNVTHDMSFLTPTISIPAFRLSRLRSVHELRIWTSEDLTRADSLS